ncbi:MAG: AAA family ATPase [Treponema sp.]|jgi:predicted ATPase|nr:AAA family ATPase [Treponema sp.]
MLTNIAIEGFKSIKKQTIPLNNITIVIGANGAGKSNLVSFFKMLNCMLSGGLQQFIGKEGGAQSLLYYGPKNTRVLTVSLSLEINSHKDVYEFSLAKAVQDTLIFAEEAAIFDGHKKEFGSGQKESVLSAERNIDNWTLKDFFSGCRFFQFHDTSDTARIRNNSYIERNKYLYSDAGNLPAYLYMLKNVSDNYRKYYDRIVEKIRYVMPQFGDFVLEPQEVNPANILLNWHEATGEYLFGPHQISDGVLRFMALATLLLQPPERLPKIIIIDEPELGLHPQAIDLLGGMILTAGRHTQIIAATQSPRLLDSFNCENVLVAERDNADNCSVFKRLDVSELSQWLDEYSLSQLWEKNVLGGQP